MDVQQKLMAGAWPRPGVKIVILITGQAEAAAGHPAMQNSVTNALSSVRHAYNNAVVLLCAPLPRARDGPLVLKDLEVLSDIMHKAYTQDSCYEFSSIGSYFYGKYRLTESRSGSATSVLLVKRGLMDPQGITLEGSRLVQKRISDKIKSANLYERYVMLSSKLIVL